MPMCRVRWRAGRARKYLPTDHDLLAGKFCAGGLRYGRRLRAPAALAGRTQHRHLQFSIPATPGLSGSFKAIGMRRTSKSIVVLFCVVACGVFAIFFSDSRLVMWLLQLRTSPILDD